MRICLLYSKLEDGTVKGEVLGETNLQRLEVSIAVRRRHAHRLILGWGRSRAIRSASWTRVVLGAAPRKTNARVTNGVTLHLVDGHLSSMALDELNETTALSGGDLDIGNLAKALEEGAELILSNIARKASNEDGGVVGVGELIHGLGSTIVVDRGRSTHGVHSWATHTGTSTSTGSHTALHWHASWASTTRLVLWGGSRDSHGSVAAVNALHLSKSALLVLLIGETDEAITTRHARDGVCHYLG